VSIGEELSEARRQAGLTVAEISQRTRIRETIIRGIERDDYAGCGGDFYARGFIRAIARTVGADPAPFIRDYDAGHRALAEPEATPPGPGATPPEPEVPRRYNQLTPVWLPGVRQSGRSRLNVTALLALALAIAVGLASYFFISGSRHTPGAAGEKAANIASGRHHAVLPATPKPSAAPSASEVVVQLTAIEDCWVEFTTARGGYLFQSYVSAGGSRRWIFGRAVDMRLGNPGGVTLRVNGTNPLPPGISHPITLRLGVMGSAG
jgi:cytoskeletal protein RodZ